MSQSSLQPVRNLSYKWSITLISMLFIVAPFLRWSVFKIDDLSPPTTLIAESIRMLETDNIVHVAEIWLSVFYLLLTIVPFGLYVLSVALAWAGIGIHRKLRMFSLALLTFFIVGGGLFIIYEGFYRHLEGAWLSRVALLAAWLVEREHRRQSA